MIGVAAPMEELIGLWSVFCGCQNFSASIGTPAEAAPLPKDADGAPTAESFNYAAVKSMQFEPTLNFCNSRCYSIIGESK